MSAPYGAPQQVPRPPATPEPSGGGTDLTSYLSMGAAGAGLIGYVLGFVDTDVANLFSGLPGFSLLIAAVLAGMRLLPKAPGTLYAAPPLALYATLALLQQVIHGSSTMVIVLFVLALLQCGALVTVVLIEAGLINQKKDQQPGVSGQASAQQPPAGPPPGPPGRTPGPGGPHTGPQSPAPPRQPGPHQSGPYPQQPPQQQAPYPPQPPQGPPPGQPQQQPWNAAPAGGWNAAPGGPGGQAPASAGFASQPTESTSLSEGPAAESRSEAAPDLLGEFSREPAKETGSPAYGEFRPAEERQDSGPTEAPSPSNGPQGTQQMPHPGREGGSTPPTF